MISPKMSKALNDQINAELYSAYLYLAMAAHFFDKNLNGFANWMRVQSMEELMHAWRFYTHIKDRDGRVELQPIEGPPKEWKSPLVAIQEAYQHECYITGRIHSLVELALKEKDRAAATMLEWFVNEQVEEEASTKEVADQLKLMGDKGSVLFMLDRELAQRMFVMPPVLPEGGAQ